MMELDLERPLAKMSKRRTFRLFGERRQPTPEEIAERNAAETARKIKLIFQNGIEHIGITSLDLAERLSKRRLRQFQTETRDTTNLTGTQKI